MFAVKTKLDTAYYDLLYISVVCVFYRSLIKLSLLPHLSYESKPNIAKIS